MKHVVAIIPARYKSSRFPGKPLVNLLGKPMIVRVAELTSRVLGSNNVYVATDDHRIADTVYRYDIRAIMTSDLALTGTDRVWEAAQKIDADTFMNVQGDEPLLFPGDILNILKMKEKYPDDVINGMCPISPHEDPANNNIPKVITTEDKKLIYISRLPIPGFMSKPATPIVYYKQVCIYAFNLEQLRIFGEFGRKSYLEHLEDIEILRFLDLGISVRMVETSGDTHAVDVPADVVVVEELLRKKENAGS